MSKFQVLVIIPPDTSNIYSKVKELLSPYYSELEVEPYKEYLDQASVETEVQDLPTLLRNVTSSSTLAESVLAIKVRRLKPYRQI